VIRRMMIEDLNFSESYSEDGLNVPGSLEINVLNSLMRE
jgi:hypothetical protein